MKILYFVLLAVLSVGCQNDIFSDKSLEIASNFIKFRNVLNLDQLQVNIRHILKRNYDTGAVSKCKYQLEMLIISKAITASAKTSLHKKSLKENSREVVKEIIMFGQEHPGISASLIGLSQRILSRVKNLKLSSLTKDSIIFPVLYSLGFLTTGYLLGIFEEIQDYFLKKFEKI